jgi:hypothetical protein
MKKLNILLIAAFVVCQGVCHSQAGSLFTKSSEFTKAATYGMNIATYTAEKKNGKEAAAKLMEFDVLFDLAGKGEEFLLNGDPDAFPKFKDNVLKIKLVLDKIAEVASKLGSGNYDEAAIAGIDTMVGLVNHPVVNATWEAIKLTIESRKLVQDSKAALEIETLYNIVNRDRRLIRTGSADTPALIPVDSGTITYFFNKYLIVNASTRALVKTYVRKTLGEEFPEMPAGARIWAGITFTTDAVKTEYELKKLEEYKNTSRRWIKELLQDLNKQVKAQWAQTRALQQAQKFKVFYSRVGRAFKNMHSAMEYFAKITRLKKEKDKFPGYLKKFNKQTDTLISRYSTLKDTQFRAKMDIRAKLYEIAKQCHVFAVNSMIIDEFNLKDSFEKLQIRCLKFINQIDKKAEDNEIRTAQALTKPTTQRNGYPVDSRDIRYEKMMLSCFSPVIPAYTEIIATIRPLSMDKIKDLLSEGRIDDALLLVDKWNTKKVAPVERKALAAVSQTLKNLEEKKPEPETAEIILQGANLIGLSHKASLEEIRDDYWKKARKKTITALDAVKTITHLKISNQRHRANAMIMTWRSKANDVRSIVQENLRILKNIEKGAANIYVHKWLADYKNFLATHSHVSIGRIPEPSQDRFSDISMHIRAEQYSLARPVYRLENMINALSVADEQAYKLQILKENWAKFPRLEDETIRLFKDFTGTNPHYQERINNINRILSATDPGTIKSQAAQFIVAARTQIENRQKDIDYLATMRMQFDAWYDKYKKAGIIVFDPSLGEELFGIRKDIRTGYGLIQVPYPHYATRKDFTDNPAFNTAQEDLKNLRVFTLIKTAMPKARQFLESQFSGTAFKLADQDNFLIGLTPVWEEDVKKALALIKNTKAGSPDVISKLKKIAEWFPSILTFPPVEREKSIYIMELKAKLGVFHKLDTSGYENSALGKKYIELRKKIQELRLEERNFIMKRQQENFMSQAKQKYLKEYKKKLAVLEDRAAQLMNSSIITRGKIDELSRDYWKIRTAYFNYKPYQSPKITTRIMGFDKMLARLENNLEAGNKDKIKKIRSLYEEFRSAYENKDEYAVMNLLSEDWDSGDGTSPGDLEENLRNMFSVYDSIDCVISNLNVTRQPDQRFTVNYEIKITGRIFETGITREEKSSVSEEIVFENKQPRIHKTLQGVFWYRH